jgi:hypothetical protein
MKRMITAMCASTLLLGSTTAFAQASGAVGASGPPGMKDSAMTSDLMASGAMGVKQHRGKHAKMHGMNAEPAASGEKGK